MVKTTVPPEAHCLKADSIASAASPLVETVQVAAKAGEAAKRMARAAETKRIFDGMGMG